MKFKEYLEEKTKPKFKVGDKVDFYDDAIGYASGTIKKITGLLPKKYNIKIDPKSLDNPVILNTVVVSLKDVYPLGSVR